MDEKELKSSKADAFYSFFNSYSRLDMLYLIRVDNFEKQLEGIILKHEFPIIKVGTMYIIHCDENQDRWRALHKAICEVYNIKND